MKTFKTFLTAAFAATLFLFLGCTSGADAPADANAVDSTAVVEESPAPIAAIPDSMDVLKKAPNVYKLLADSLGIRLFENVFEPGETAVLHMHPDHAAYCVEGGTLELSGADGKKTVFELKPGMGFIFGPDTHSATNIGKTTVRAVIVEVNRPR